MKNLLISLILIGSISMATPLSQEEQQNARKGAETFNKILKESTLSQDTQTLNRIKKVGKEIAKQVKKDYNWEFALIENKALNAFCLSGGKVVFYTGMFSVIENNEQLAAVMSHEIAHVLLKHSSMRNKANKILNVPQKLGKNLFGDLVPKNVQGVLDTVHETGKNLTVMMPYSREQESEADREGVKLMIRAGYNPYEAIKLWENIKKISKNSQEIPEFLSTHPSNNHRITTIKNTIANSKR